MDSTRNWHTQCWSPMMKAQTLFSLHRICSGSRSLGCWCQMKNKTFSSAQRHYDSPYNLMHSQNRKNPVLSHKVLCARARTHTHTPHSWHHSLSSDQPLEPTVNNKPLSPLSQHLISCSMFSPCTPHSMFSYNTVWTTLSWQPTPPQASPPNLHISATVFQVESL